MISTLIVDDEKPARDEIRYLLGQHDDVEIVGEAANGDAAIAMVHDLKPDLVVLDIHMPGKNGFDVAEASAAVAATAMPHVIFVTAYDQYAIRAFEVNAVDYVLKPVDERRLASSLERLRQRIAAGTESGDDIAKLLQTIRAADTGLNQRPPRLSVRKGDRYLLVDPADATHAHILDGVVFLATAEFEGVTIYRTLEELEQDLDPMVFWRVHRGHVVNIDHVDEIIPAQNGTYRMRLDDASKTVVPLSRAQAKRLRKVLRW
jgi:two-component system, LytTR family, response regulator LytT